MNKSGASAESPSVTISIVMPCYNEAGNIIDAVNMIVSGIAPTVEEYEIILVDDGSEDNSQEVIRGLLATNYNVRAVFHPENVGKGGALRSGFDHARMDWILIMDADLQIDISELSSFLPFCPGYDIITGYRTGRDDGVFRTVVSTVYNLLVSAVVGVTIRDVGCPFKLLKTSAVRNMPLTSDGFAIDAEIFQNARMRDYRIKELPVKSHPRLKGKSSVRVRNIIATFISVIALKLKRTG